MTGNGHASHVWKEKRHEILPAELFPAGIQVANVGFLSETVFFSHEVVAYFRCGEKEK